jgi:hypothetical protein
MTEFSNPDEFDNKNANIHFGEFTYAEFIDQMAKLAPEIDARKEELTTSATRLIKHFGVNRDFFKAEDNAIGLLLASALDSEAIRTDGKANRKIEFDQVVADNFARTLFGRYSETYPWEEVHSASGLPDAEKLELHLRHTNRKLSGRLEDWMLTNEEFLAVRAELGITDDLEDFKILVLEIGDDEDTKGIGEAEKSLEGINEYTEKLKTQGETFMQELMADPNDSIPYAFTTTMMGQKFLCVTEATARILLEPEKVGYYEDVDRTKKLIGLMRHEFVHSQGDLSLTDASQEHESNLGILIEEYRAEIYSGSYFYDAYYDVYSNVGIIEECKNFNLKNLMHLFPCGGTTNKPELYGLLIQNIGLNNTARLTGLLPENYYDFQSPKSSRELFDALDDGDLERSIIDEMTKEELNAYIETKTRDSELDKEEFKKRIYTLWDLAHSQ